MGGGRRYLFISNFPNKNLNDKVLQAFMRKAFLTNAILYFVINESVDEYPYIGRLNSALSGGTCNIKVLIKNRVPIFQIIAEMDYYIAGNNREEWLYLKTAYENGVEIIGFIESAEEMFSDIPALPQVEDLKNDLQQNILRLFKDLPPIDYEYFLFHNGLGESMGFFYWIKEYRRLGNKGIVLFCRSNAHVSLMALSPYVDGIFKIDNLLWDYIQIYFAEKYGIKNFNQLHVDENVLEGNKKRLSYAEYSIISGVQDFLEIPPAVKFERYEVNLPADSISNAYQVFDKLGLIKGRTVFMITEGVSQNLFHHKNFWIKLAAQLKEKNFEVVTNSKEEVIPNCKNVFIPLADTVTFAGLCGYVVTQLTGFSEAICSLNSKDKIKLYILTHSESDLKNCEIISWHSFQSLQYYGRQQKNFDSFGKYLNFIMGSNVQLKKMPFGNTSEDDDSIIKKIVADITS